MYDMQPENRHRLACPVPTRSAGASLLRCNTDRHLFNGSALEFAVRYNVNISHNCAAISPFERTKIIAARTTAREMVMVRTLSMAMVLALISSMSAKGASHCNLKRYPNLACDSQFVRCVCLANGRCHWVFECK